MNVQVCSTETRVEWKDAFEELDLCRAKRDRQRFHICMQVLDLPPPDDREDVRSLLQEVCKRNCTLYTPSR